jgi:hypothetical protein
LIVYSGLVPMSPKTMPSAARARPVGIGRRKRSAFVERDRVDRLEPDVHAVHAFVRPF